MRKHLFLAHSAAPSGAELALLRLSALFPPDKVVVMFAEDGALIERFREAGVEVIVRETDVENVRRSERSSLRKLRAIAELVRYGWRLGAWARHSGINLIVANSVKSLLYGSVASIRSRVPIVWSVHDRISSDYFRRIDTLLIRILGRILANAYIVNSQSTLDTVWVGNKPTLISPPGIVPTAHLEAPARRVSPLTQVSMVGRLSPWKGQLLFIEAFDRVFKNTDVKAIVVGGALFGEHDYAAQVYALAAQSASSDRIVFTGNVDNVAGILAKSQILVHSSIIPEPFGSVVVEGLDAGCAVIATTPGGPAEVITDGYNGLLVACNDLDMMESALRRLAEDHELRIKLAENGVTRAKDFDVRNLARSMASWLDSIESGKGVERVSSSIPQKPV